MRKVQASARVLDINERASVGERHDVSLRLTADQKRTSAAASAIEGAKVAGEGSFWVTHGVLLAAIAGGLAARVVFWLYTQRVWEDALITIQHARNAARGLGLTHHLGEGRVHGFTSSLSVVIPLAGEVVWPDSAMLALRLATLAATVVTLWYAAGIARELALSRWPTALVLGYLAFDQNQIFYGMTGMETQVAVAVLLAGIYYVLQGKGRKRGVACGVCFGLALLARPDFALWLGPAGLLLLLRNWRAGLKAAAVGLAIVLPWLVFTTLYYGSPVPHTILAKANAAADHPLPGEPSEKWLRWLAVRAIEQGSAFIRYATPLFEDEFVLQTPFPRVFLTMTGVGLWILTGTGFWAVRKLAGSWPTLAFVLLFMVYRVLFLSLRYYGWYMVPFMAVTVILAAAGLEVTGKRWGHIKPVTASLLLTLYAMHLVWSLPLERKIADLEEHVRKPLGQYIAAVVRPDQSIASESAGFVGYYGQALLYDFPGLTSQASYDVLRRLPVGRRTLNSLINGLRPDWLVLRPDESRRLREQYRSLWEQYEVTQRFTAPADVTTGETGQLAYAGTRIATFDSDFMLMSRQDGCKARQ